MDHCSTFTTITITTPACSIFFLHNYYLFSSQWKSSNHCFVYTQLHTRVTELQLTAVRFILPFYMRLVRYSFYTTISYSAHNGDLQTTVLFTRNFTQGSLNYNWLLPALSCLFICALFDILLTQLLAIQLTTAILKPHATSHKAH